MPVHDWILTGDVEAAGTLYVHLKHQPFSTQQSGFETVNIDEKVRKSHTFCFSYTLKGKRVNW